MRKVLAGLLGLVLIAGFLPVASAEKQNNIYSNTTFVNAANPSRAFTFPFRSVDISVKNQDSSAANEIYINFRNTTVPITTDLPNDYVLLQGGDEILLYNYGTDGIAIKPRFTTASPITVTVVY